MLILEYKLEKWIWTEKDFDQMGWHDATVYGFRLNGNLEFDLDNVFQWNQPETEGFYFTFWVAPVTLVFDAPSDLSFELIQSFDDKWLEISDIEVKLIGGKKDWKIITQQGDISFKSDSYRQVVRRKPSFQVRQTISYDERGGFSFDLTTGENLKEETTPEIRSRREKQFADYELARARYIVKKELESLIAKRDAGQIQVKDFLIEKKELNQKIDSLNSQLLGTHYEIDLVSNRIG